MKLNELMKSDMINKKPNLKKQKLAHHRGGNYYPKYHTKNPIARKLMRGFLHSFDRLINYTHAKTAYEIGCGEGYLSQRLLDRGIKVQGCDIDATVIAKANHIMEQKGMGAPFTVGDIYALSPHEIKVDLIVCCEVLEHLPDPKQALHLLSQVQARYILLSVPREPIWRLMNMARGKYLGALGNTPGHLQHWSKLGFIKMTSNYTRPEIIVNPLPWTMVLCRNDLS